MDDLRCREPAERSAASGGELTGDGFDLGPDVGCEEFRSTGSRPIGQTVEALLEEPLAPLIDRFGSDTEQLGDGHVLMAVGRHQHDASPHHPALLRCVGANPTLQLCAFCLNQLDEERTRPAHRHLQG